MDVPTARTFLAAAATGSFVAAARRVHASPPTVTERIKQLEHVLGARLFDRDRRGCRLTAAGRRLVEPAQAMVRAWDEGCARVALPPRFEAVIRLGGQHALWPSLLIPWLGEVRDQFSRLAVSALAAAPAQLNRAIEEDELDIVFLYDPVQRLGVRVEELAPDRLVLATARPGLDWKENFVRLNWGESASAALMARLDVWPSAGLELDLGALSLQWLVDMGASGFVPERMARPFFAKRLLEPVDDTPSIDFSPYVCWRSSMDEDLAARLVDLAKRGMTT
ncbi:LysR family transcriptional regulator [Novosphingobium sp. JCM 18896]|uniref:LysR family transcriptional regulator n=1 Tax=Novosphingobium sp. JCM 18896 TaxID=2989731 RepID=UPI002221C299|nr:LysR family transcriptional regulator [Novosphingobium sp. JCM 18896]MCW1431661.1 LysR family transcriptional regulator [Novosphingobium sp. JCM 18896]